MLSDTTDRNQQQKDIWKTPVFEIKQHITNDHMCQKGTHVSERNSQAILENILKGIKMKTQYHPYQTPWDTASNVQREIQSFKCLYQKRRNSFKQ